MCASIFRQHFLVYSYFVLHTHCADWIRCVTFCCCQSPNFRRLCTLHIYCCTHKHIHTHASCQQQYHHHHHDLLHINHRRSSNGCVFHTEKSIVSIFMPHRWPIRSKQDTFKAMKTRKIKTNEKIMVTAKNIANIVSGSLNKKLKK